MKVSNSKERLLKMMELLEIKQVDIVNKTGIAKSALSNYLSGTREPRQDQISKIADPFKINPAWLMGYDVPMYLSEAPQYTEELFILEDKYSQLSEVEKKSVMDMIDFLLSKHNA